MLQLLLWLHLVQEIQKLLQGVLVEENVKAQFSGPETSAIKYILIAADVVTLPNGVETCNEALYVDNIKLYESNEL